MTTPTPSAPAILPPIPRGCLCRHVDGTIGHVYPDVRVGNRTATEAIALGLYRLDLGDSWRLDVARTDLAVLSLEEAQDHELRQRAAAKARRAIAAMRATPDFGDTLPMTMTRAKRHRPVIDVKYVEVV